MGKKWRRLLRIRRMNVSAGPADALAEEFRNAKLDRFSLSLDVYKANPALAFCLPRWEAAMGACFLLEAEVRLAAGKYFPAESVGLELGDKSPSKRGLLTLLFSRVQFEEGEQVVLRKCVGLRNKLIHCEPDALQKQLKELVQDFEPQGQVVQMRFPEGATAAEMIKIVQTRAGAVPVQETVSRSEGFHGWMLEASANGTFEMAVEVFRVAIAMINSKLSPQKDSL